jgi:CDP-glucose 4,6-dehydratase
MSFYTGKRVLLTGASGFIGSHLAHRLVEDGAILFCTEHRTQVRDGLGVQCDLADMENVMRVVSEVQPEVVFHLAAQALVRSGENASYQTLTSNVVGTMNLLMALTAVGTDPQSVVVASSDKSYGRHQRLPYDERDALLGTEQVYEASKVCTDVLAQMAAYSWKLPIGITRFGNVYGPGDRHMSRLIPGVMESFFLGEAPYIRSDGQHYRDYVFIDDVVDGYLRLGQWVARRFSGPQIYNFGTGVPSRVLDVVALISEQFPNVSAAPHILNTASDEIPQQYVDSTKALQDLEWSAKVPLRKGIQITADWYKDFPNSEI